MANPRPFVVDTALTAIAIGYVNPADSLIADRVLPRMPVGGEKFKWLEYPIAEGLTVPDTLVGRKGRVNKIEFSATERTGSVDDYGLEDDIPQSDVDAAAQQRAAGLSVYDPRGRAASMLTRLIELDREVRVAGLVFALGTYSASLRATLSGTSQWSDFANSAPIDVITAALDQPVMRPNTAVFGQATWTRLRQHPHVVNAIKGGNLNRGMVSREQFAELFELKEVLVGQSFLNTASKGQAATLARTWGKHAAFLYIDAATNTDVGNFTFGFTAQHGTRLAGSMENPNIGLKGGETIRVGETVKEIIAAQGAGYFFQNAVA